MDKIVKFIDCYIPITYCNLQCKYCYIKQSDKFQNKIPGFRYSAEYIGKALSQKRLGGICHINLCGGGETLIPQEITGIIEELLKQGHYLFVVTNGTLSKRFDEILNLDQKLLRHLGFKFSFHYDELICKNLMDTFFENVKKVQKAGCSFSIELTPHDEIIDERKQIINKCIKEVGAACHVTVARKDNYATKPILTNLSKKEYFDTWSVFKSKLFKFKMSTFNKKRNEFCYAGEWSLYVNLGSGVARQCYCSNFEQNIFENIDKPLKFLAIGNNCKEAHCYNSHAFLTLGLIPNLKTPTYASLRNRKTNRGEWLNSDMKQVLSQKLYKNNRKRTFVERVIINLINSKW